MDAERWKLLRRDLLVRQDLAVDTARKTLRSLEALEAGGVDLAAPTLEQYESFMEKRKLAGARGAALSHQYKAMQRLLSWHRVRWPELESPTVTVDDVQLPPDHIVLRLVNLAGDQDDAELELLQFNMRFGFFTGARPQQEHVSVRVDDYNRETKQLRLWSDKVERGRTLDLEPWLAGVIEHYIDEIRPRVDAGVSKQLILTPEGKPWSRSAHRMWLSRAGREIYPWFYPYLMRHWSVTWRLEQTNMNVPVVARWHGHRKWATTEKYSHLADARLARAMRAFEIPPLSGLAIVSSRR